MLVKREIKRVRKMYLDNNIDNIIFYTPIMSLKLMRFLYKKKYNFTLYFCRALAFNDKLKLLKYCIKKIKKYGHFNGALLDTYTIIVIRAVYSHLNII